MESFACGQIGLSLNDFYDMTPRQFFNISKGYKKQQTRIERLSWEQTRAVMYAIHLSIPKDPKKGKKTVSLQEFLPFDWEQEKEVKKENTTEEIEKLHKKWDKVKFDKEY